jgi:hypothetical protein
MVDAADNLAVAYIAVAVTITITDNSSAMVMKSLDHFCGCGRWNVVRRIVDHKTAVRGEG